MASKKKAAQTSGEAALQTLKIGTCLRYTGEGDKVDGRITWANGTHVKIRWNDGEQVTWKRAELADKPIQILEGAGNDGHPEPTPVVAEPTDQAAAPLVAGESPVEHTPETAVPADVPPTPEATATEPAPVEQTTTEQAATPAPAKVKKARAKKANLAPGDGQEKKVSCLDAAARVLAEEGQPMSCKEMIDAMAARDYWTSPGGKTPDATLYSAILRELAKGADCRFAKTERGKFGRKA